MFACDDGEYSAQAEPHGTQRLNQLKRNAFSQVSSLRDSSSMAFTGSQFAMWLSMAAAFFLIKTEGASLTPTPSVCVHDLVNTPYIGDCMVNPKWRISQPAVSPLAKIDKAQAIVSAACASHVIDGTEASFKSCNADVANKCYVMDSAQMSSAPVWFCKSAVDASIPYLCPGSFIKEYRECLTRSSEVSVHFKNASQSPCEIHPLTQDCTKDPRCVNQQVLLQAMQMSTNHTLDKLNSFGTVYKYGYCYSKKVPFSVAMIYNETTYNQTEDEKAWAPYIEFADKFIGPTTPEDILNSYGSCPYAKQVSTYIPYESKCNGGGLAYGNYLFFSDFWNSSSPINNNTNLTTSTVNTTALIECLTSGCSIRVTPGKEISRQSSGAYDHPYVLCSADQETIAKLKYPRRVYEASLVQAASLCARAELQYNKTACETAKI